MSQRSDSVFLWIKDSFRLAFTYRNKLGDTAELKNLHYAVKIITRLQSIGDTLGFRKHTFDAQSRAFDVYVESKLIILDRIGAINADISVISSQGKLVNGAEFYRLTCYKDSEVGELELRGKGCDLLLSNSKISTLQDFEVVNQVGGINIRLPNQTIGEVKKVVLYSNSGVVIWQGTIPTSLNELFVSTANFPQGMIIITIKGNSSFFKPQKTVIFGNR